MLSDLHQEKERKGTNVTLFKCLETRSSVGELIGDTINGN